MKNQDQPIATARLLLVAILKAAPVLLAAALSLLPAATQAQGAAEAWVQRYNGPGNGSASAGAVAVDASGNVIVTGSSASTNQYPYNYDFTTIKYSSAGVPLWTNRYNGPGNDTDQANAVAVDSVGDVYVVGCSLNNSNNSLDMDYATIKYSSAGVPLWTNRYNGPGDFYDEATAISVDASGNVIVTGHSAGPPWDPFGYPYDYATIKYSSVGVPLWTNRYGAPLNYHEYPTALAVDATGNVIVTGFSTRTMNDPYTLNYDYATIKYSSAGVPLWTNFYNGSGNYYDRARAMAVDAGGNVYVTGESATTSVEPFHYAFVTIKYSTAGVPLWTNRFNMLPYRDAGARALAIDGHGDVVVSGYLTTAANWDYATVKYSSAGVPLWTNLYNGPGNSWDEVSAMVADGSGNAYVTGGSEGNGSGKDYATVAYSSSGAPLWTNRYNGPANNYDYAKAVAVDASGNVYVTGYSYMTNNSCAWATIKYVPLASAPPILISQPLSRTNVAGTTASFAVGAAGGVPLSYQWRLQGTNLLDGGSVSGVTTTNLLLANVQPSDAGGYTVVVTNTYGSITSSVAQLTVISPGRFTRLAYSPETGFSFIFRDGTLGRPYRIQRSPTLAEGSWVDWQSFTYTGPIALTDLGAPEVERRYYRAVSP